MITRAVTRPVVRSVARGPLDGRGAGYPSSLALLWQGKFLTFNGKFLIWRP